MALYDTADILARAKRRLNRPATDEAFTVSATDDVWYAFFTEAQSRVYTLIATHCPDALYGAPVLMTSADSGATYTFGTDSGLPTNYTNIFPLGQVEIRSGRAGTVLLPGTDWDDDSDHYVPEGEKIRWPNGKTRTFSDGPYARFIQPPGVIDASTGVPTLEPVFARVLIVDDGVTRAAARLHMDTSEYEAAFQQDWSEVLHALKAQYFGHGLVAHSGMPRVWWRGSMGVSR